MAYKSYNTRPGHRPPPSNRRRTSMPSQRGHNGRRRRRRINPGRFILFIVIVAVIVGAAFFGIKHLMGSQEKYDLNSDPTETPAPYVEDTTGSTDATTDGTTDGATEGDTAANTPTVAAVDSTQPSNFGFQTDIMVNGEIVDSYERQTPISFPTGNEYTSLTGVSTLRGNNYRNTGSYGAVDVTNKTLDLSWSVNSGELTRWTGSGYPSQPAIIGWSDEMKSIMNLYEDKKTKENLVEVIYPTMDGKIYFIDAITGEATRDPIDMGVSVKGSCSIDPRGYPILYVGQGVGNSGDYSHDNASMMIYSLIDGSLLYEHSYEDADSFSHRPSWQAYDASPLVSAEADTLIWPGENGVLYTFKLNTDFDISAGTVAVSPDEPVKYRYTTPDNVDGPTDADTSSEEYLEASTKRWYGMENSPAAYKNYLYFTDNGGWLQCVDLNTMTLVWAQDVTDDTDASLVIDDQGNTVSIYTGCEVDKAAASGAESGTSYIRKINALTGEIVWEKTYECFVKHGVDGGVMGTPVLGKGNLDGMVIFAVARAGESVDTGKLVALNKEDGSVIWETDMDHYAWASPVGVYTTDGTGYIVQCDSAGNVMLVDGLTGEALSSVNVGSNIEASPAVFNNVIVVGTRGEKICGIKIS